MAPEMRILVIFALHVSVAHQEGDLLDATMLGPPSTESPANKPAAKKSPANKPAAKKSPANGPAAPTPCSYSGSLPGFNHSCVIASGYTAMHANGHCSAPPQSGLRSELTVTRSQHCPMHGNNHNNLELNCLQNGTQGPCAKDIMAMGGEYVDLTWEMSKYFCATGNTNDNVLRSVGQLPMLKVGHSAHFEVLGRQSVNSEEGTFLVIQATGGANGVNNCRLQVGVQVYVCGSCNCTKNGVRQLIQMKQWANKIDLITEGAANGTASNSDCGRWFVATSTTIQMVLASSRSIIVTQHSQGPRTCLDGM